MGLSAKQKYYIKRILPFGIIWLVIGWLLMWTEYAVISGQEATPNSAIPITPIILLFATVSVFLVGCLVGAMEVFYVDRLFTRLSFPKKIIGKFTLYTIVLSVTIFILYMLAASIVSKTSVFSTSVWDQYVVFFFSITHISTGVQLLFSLLVSLLYAEVSENLGQNLLLNFFTGKYHNPVVEERIFMFVDMKDSTAIAEKLGHQEYFKLLSAYYVNFSNAIIKNQGEVYQYVGDEIVITWKLKNGLTHNQCISCFFDMKKDLQSKQTKYQKKYGVLLKFKAALHCGQVTTGAIGALKKDIFFTGDVLNTTARILGLASSYGEDLLISERLSQQLNLSESYDLKDFGTPQLKGKLDGIRIFAVHNQYSTPIP